MWKDALLDLLSAPRELEPSDVASTSERLSDLVIYSVWSTNDQEEVLFAFTDCYVDELITQGVHGVGETVFRLNAFALDRETFRLEQELAITALAEARMEPSYVEQLIKAPLAAATRAAEAAFSFAERFLQQMERRFESGLSTITDVVEARYLVEERRAALTRSRLNEAQRLLELEAQERRLEAEKRDLAVRMELNRKISGAHQYKLTRPASVELHTYLGAFIEEGDPICTVRYA